MPKQPENAGSDVAELKALFRLAQNKPIHAAFGLGSDGKAVIKLDKLMKPKVLAKALMEAKVKPVYFGTVAIDPSDAATANFTITKPVSGIQGKLVIALKGSGVSKVNISVGGDEADDDDRPDQGEDPADTAAQPAPSSPEAPIDPAANAAAPAAAAEPSAPAPDTASPAETAGEPAPPPPQAPAAPAATTAPATPTAAAEPPAPAPNTRPAATESPRADADALTRQLTALVKQMITAIVGSPEQKATLTPLAVAAQASLKQGDLQQAAAAIASLRQALADGAAASATPDPAGQQAPASRNGAPADAATIAKSSAAWTGARKKIEGEMDKLKKELLVAFKDHSAIANVEKAFQNKMVPMMKSLDAKLSDKLADLAKADGDERTKLVGEAQDIIVGYRSFIDSEPLIKAIDSNPFVPVTIEKTLMSTLAILERTIR